MSSPSGPFSFAERRQLELDPTALAYALDLPTQEVRDLFRTGTVSAHFCWRWAARLYGLSPQGAVGASRLQLSGRGVTLQIRTLAAKVQFQRSHGRGTGRQTDPHELVQAVSDVDGFIVADVTEFPTVHFVPVSSDTLRAWANSGYLQPSGLDRDEFYRLVQ